VAVAVLALVSLAEQFTTVARPTLKKLPDAGLHSVFTCCPSTPSVAATL
jgi:hypothetical protein